jgi:hypothetical protein
VRTSGCTRTSVAVPAEDAAGDLERVAEVDARVGFGSASSRQVEVGDELGEREDDRLERGIEVLDVSERVLDLERVVQAHVELLPEGALQADGHLDLAVSDDGRARRRVHLDQKREDVELRPDEPRRARFDEAGLAKLRLEPLLGQRLDGPCQVVDANGVEDAPGLNVTLKSRRPPRKL